jgi:hypothetical protein
MKRETPKAISARALCTMLAVLLMACAVAQGANSPDRKSPKIHSFYIEPSVMEGGWVIIKERGAKAIVRARGLTSVKIYFYSTGTGIGEMPPGEIGPLKKVATSPDGDTWEIAVPDVMVTNFWCEGSDAHGRHVKGPDLGNVAWNVGPSHWQTFTSPDGMFQFQYSEPLVRCTIPEGTEEEPYKLRTERAWQPRELCTCFHPICDDPSVSDSLACIAHPDTRAAFFVAVVPDAKSEDSCLAGSKNWWSTSKPKHRTINGIRLRLFRISEASAGKGAIREIYRVFHQATCYELGIQEAYSTGEESHPLNLGESDQAHTLLTPVLQTFTFLK